jgi:histidinol-phosphate aminotransferase
MADPPGKILVEIPWVFGLTQENRMIHPKKHLRNIYRSDPERFDRTRYLRLDKNEDLCGLPEDLVKKCLSRITPDELSAYPQTYLLYDALSRYLSVPREKLLITAGSDAAIKNTFEVFVSPEDGVIIPDPTYAMYEVYANLFNAKLTKVPYAEDLSFSVRDMIGSIGDSTRLVAIPNPNSPTGTTVSREEIIDLIEYCHARDVLVLIDEAYYPFYPHTVIDLVDKYSNLIVTRTFSKAFGLAALRLGYLAADPQIIRYLKIFRPIYETHGLAVSLGCAVLENPDFVGRNVRDTVDGRQYLIDQMKRIGFSPYPSYSNFVNIPVDNKIRDPLISFLERKGILIKAGADHPALRSCIRITAGPKNMMKTVIQAIELFMADPDNMP